jgi:hypothetical protein
VISPPIQRILGSAFFGAVALMALGGAGTVLHVQSPLFRPLGIGLAVVLGVLFLAGSLLFLARPFRAGVALLHSAGIAAFASWCAGGPDEIDGTEPDAVGKLTGVALFVLYTLLAWTVVAWTLWALVARVL